MAGLIGTPNNNLGGSIPSFYEYEIDYACRFNDDDSAALDVAAAPAMDDAKIFSLSFWIKRCNLGLSTVLFNGGVDINNSTYIYFTSIDKIEWSHADAGGVTDQMVSTMVFRDTTNWYHIFIRYDSTEAAAGDRQRIWVNGSEITVWDTDNQAALNKECDLGGNLLNIACEIDNTNYLDAYLAEMHFIDGTVYAVTDFGEFKNGVWIPIVPSVTYGSAGFYLPFSNSADFGSDQSGNSNDFTDVNLNTNDQVVDTPTNNYCVLNVIKKFSDLTFSNGNLENLTVNGTWTSAYGTFAIPRSGKWYWEVQTVGADYLMVGITTVDSTHRDNAYPGQDAVGGLDAGYSYWRDGTKYINSAQTGYGDAMDPNDIIGIALNMDDDEITFYLNNVSQGVIAIGETDIDWLPASSDGSAIGGSASTHKYNFGQLGFTYTPPSRYLALNTTNIAAIHKYTSDIMSPSKGFNVVTYQGDDGATQAITGVDHQSDLVWIKNRDQADSHYLCDSVRGVTKFLESDSTNAEVTDANDGLSVFGTDGFTVMFNAFDIVNAAGENYVAWCWKEDPVYGFDIVAKNCSGGAEAINHSLGVAPELIIGKSRDDVENWFVYHHHALNKTDPETDHGHLDSTAVWGDDATIWNDVAPTSTQFTVGTEMEASDYIFYLWRSVEGFSKVFSYKGNGNADGPYVYCGFRPKFIMIKNIDAIQNYIIQDTLRSTYNIVDDYLRADDDAIEDTAGENEIDILSNGFKIRNTDAAHNTNNQTYVGIAMAELPGIYSNAR